MGWILKHSLRPQIFIISAVRVTLKISRCFKGEGKGDKQVTQQWQQGTTTTSGEESGTGVVGRVPLHACCGGPPQNLQGSGFGDIQKSGHLPAHRHEEAGAEVEGTQREVSATYPSRHKRRG